MSDATNATSVTDDDLEKNISELSGKEERTEEENNQLDQAKQEKQSRYQERINKMTWEKKSAQEEAERAKKEVEDYKQRLEALETKQNAKPVNVIPQTVDIGGKTYYTDETLMSMRDNGDMTDQDAYKLQQQRVKAEIKDEVRQEFKQESQKSQKEQAKEQDIEKVLKAHPEFSTSHPNFNPENPLYKEASRIYNNGYNTSPEGMSKSIEEAKRILRIGENVDVSDDLSMRSSSAPSKSSNEKKAEIVLSDDEKELAGRMYRDQINPKTKQAYSQAEAEDKYKQARQRRVK